MQNMTPSAHVLIILSIVMLRVYFQYYFRKITILWRPDWHRDGLIVAGKEAC